MRRIHKWGPKAAGHPTIGDECPGCHQRFVAGDYTTAVIIGPGNDPAARERAKLGRTYNAIILEAHWGCVTGLDDDEDPIADDDWEVISDVAPAPERS